MSNYSDLYNNVNEYYAGIDQWERLNSYDLTTANYYNEVSNSNYYNVYKSGSGDVMAYTYSNTTPNSSGNTLDLNSNDDSAGFTTTEIATQNSVNQSSKVSSTSALEQGTNFYFSMVRPALVAASVGIRLGKQIDATLYNLNPDFWDSHGMQAMDPSTWNSITDGNNTGLDYLFNAMFGLDPSTHDLQMYVEENAWLYTALWLSKNGFFARPYEAIDGLRFRLLPNHDRYTLPIFSGCGVSCYMKTTYIGGQTLYEEYIDTSARYAFLYNASDNERVIVIASSAPFHYRLFYRNTETGGMTTFSEGDVTTYTQLLNENLYYTWISVATGGVEYCGTWNAVNGAIAMGGTFSVQTPAFILAFGGEHGGAPDGVNEQPDATIPDINPNWTYNDLRNYLQVTYPDIYNRKVTNNVVQPDGSTKTNVYIPVSFPSGGNDTQPTGGGGGDPDQKNPKVTDDSKDETKDKAKRDTSKDTDDRPTGGDEDTGKGETPSNTTPPTPLSAGHFVTLYQVDSGSLSALGAVLWNNTIIEEIKKMFLEPMDAIIFLKQSFIAPTSTTSGNIYLGYYDTGVGASRVVGNIAYCNCGSVSLKEYFKNAFDYNNIKIRLYLPFYGFAQLDVDDVMRSAIGVRYIADLYSGQTLIEVSVMRDGNNNVLYTFECNTSLDIPITSGSYGSLMSGFLAMAGSAVVGAGSLLAGGSALTALAGASAMPSIMSHMHTDVQHGSKISGNTGADCIKTPYLIIERPQVASPDNFNEIIGYPACYVGSIGGAEGFVRCREIKLNVSCTDEEHKEILQLLESGVYVN